MEEKHLKKITIPDVSCNLAMVQVFISPWFQTRSRKPGSLFTGLAGPFLQRAGLTHSP